MRMILVCFAILSAAPAQALEFCEELWFTRNLMFHRAGYCFGSPLGKAVFGNAGCVGKDVSLRGEAARIVARVKKEEAFESCKVDTSRTHLPIPLIEIRKALVDLPFPSLFESGCIGWKGGPVPLLTARQRGSAVVGEIRRGDVLLFQFEEQSDWSFIEVTRNTEVLSMGWAQIEFNNKYCEGLAG